MTFSKTIGVQQGSFLFQVLLSISFCFLGALTQTAPGNPIITGPTNAVEGQSVSLRCTTTGGSSPVTVRWQRNTVLVDGTVDGSFTNSLGIAVNYNDYNFTVSRTDNLVSYICLVHNAALSSNLTREWTISVYVQASAPVINGPTTTLDSGNTYTYTCTAASGRPAPEIEWKLGSTVSSATTLGTGTYDPLVTNSDSTFTRISTLSWVPIIGDNGKSLFCIASQSATVPSQNAFRVISVQQIPIIRSAQSAYSTQAGQSVVLRCNVTSAFPAITGAYWQKRGNSGFQTVTTDSRISQASFATNNPDLTITNAQVSDAGEYRCFATNQAGTGSSGIITLSVTGSAPSVNIPQSSYSTVIGTSVLIPCSVSATPAVTRFQWTFQPSTGGSVTITQSGGRYELNTNWQSPSLRVVNTTFGDTGTYTCQSTNIVGTISDSTALTITGTVPNVTLSQASYSVLKGQNITLDCRVTGGVPPEITAIKWKYRATVSSSPITLNVNSNQNKYVGSTVANPNLTIFNVVDGDQGLYACIASNLYGDGESDQVLLDVTGSAPSVVVSPSALSVTQTQNATITCSVTGADPAIRDVRWEKHSSGGQVTQITIGGRFSGATTSNPSLTISFVEPSDAGIYYCTAENLVASTKSTTECSLTVTGSAPSSVSITRGGSVVTTTTVNVGSSITLSCAASGSPAPTFSWRFGGTQVATGNSYTINSVAKNQDGVYTCRATNLLSSAVGTVTVDVQYAPEDVRTAAQRAVTGSVGGTVQLSCNVDSDPTPSYRWYRNNVLISTVTTKDYNVPINSNDDFGSYSCAAQNSLGTANLAFTISNAGTGNTGASTASSGLSTGEIAAIVLALLLLLLLIIIIIICCITHGVCGAICGKKDTKGRVQPVEKEVYKETSKEVIIPRFHEESIKGKREGYGKPGSYRSYPPRAHQYWEPSAISRKDVDVRVHQNGHFRKENDYEIVRYETVPATSTHVITESPRAPRRLPKLEYSYEDVAEKKKKRRKKRHHKRRHGAEEVGFGQRSPERGYQGYHNDRIVEQVRTSSRSPSRRRRVKEDEEMIIERSSRSPSTRRRREENFMTTEEHIGNGDIIHGEGDLRAYNGVVYREAPSRHSSGRYYVEGGSMRRSHSGRRDYGSDDEVEVVYGKEYVVEH